MTGYTVHTGASKQFVSGWDRIFQSAEAAEKTADEKKPKSSAKPKAKKKRQT